MSGPRELEAALAGLPELRSAEAGPHPTPEQLVAHHQGALPPADAHRVQSHLLACRECLALLRDLEGFEGEGFEGERAPATGELDAAWRELRGRLAEAAPAPPAPPLPRPAAVPRRRGSRERLWQALAAGLAAAVLGLGGFALHLERRLDRLATPQVESTWTAQPAEGARGSLKQAPTLRASAGLHTLILHAPAATGAGYRLELRSAAGKVLWSRSGLTPAEPGLFLLSLPRESLEPGEYQLELFPGQPGERLALYRFRLAR
ncbi:MAG: hypothetical protein U0002_18170 [Thermoanaerobaculia bacterium]